MRWLAGLQAITIDPAAKTADAPAVAIQTGTIICKTADRGRFPGKSPTIAAPISH
jgi:hypothetical protein